MARKSRAHQGTTDEVEALKKRLEETEETLHAIRQYLVDAFVVDREDGTHVVTLREADFPYHLMVESMNEGAVTMIPDGTILYANSHFCEMVQREREQIIGLRFQDMVLAAEQEAFDQLLQEAGKAGQSGRRGEFCLQTVGDECIPVQLSAYELATDGTRGVSMIATDLSERKQAEDALQKSENLFRFVVTHSPDAVFTHDLNLKYTWVFNSVGPLKVEQMVGKTDWDLLPPAEAEQLTLLKKSVLATGQNLRQELSLSFGGTPHWYDAVFQPTFNGEGKVNGLIGYSRDITESVQAKERIRALASALTKAEQEERHRISQILHDDLQQRLFAIKAQLSMLTDSDQPDVPPDVLATLDQVQKDLSETVSITRNLSIGLSPAILHGEGLSDAVLWLASQMREQFDLRVDVDAKESLNQMEDHLRVLLFRAVRELLFNIVKHAGTKHAAVILEQIDGQISITVTDQGTGFDVEQALSDPRLAHGLLIIKDRLTLMGGSMEIDSKAGKGTRVKIAMPVETIPA